MSLFPSIETLKGGAGGGVQLDLVAIFEHYGARITPGRTGQMVKCPVHEDTRPSCSVNAVTGLWKCHSCGAGGDGITLIEQMEGLDFKEAVAFAERIGVAAGAKEPEPEPLTFVKRSRARREQGKKGSTYRPSWRR